MEAPGRVERCLCARRNDRDEEFVVRDRGGIRRFYKWLPRDLADASWDLLDASILRLEALK